MHKHTDIKPTTFSVFVLRHLEQFQSLETNKISFLLHSSQAKQALKLLPELISQPGQRAMLLMCVQSTIL